MNTPRVTAVHRSATHDFSKQSVPSVFLVVGLGVEGDAHSGVTVQHRSRVAADPTQPNLRQVHLMHSELHAELRARGFQVHAGDLGENITTSDLNLLELPTGTRLQLGSEAVVEITGLRNPCQQIESFQAGLLSAVVARDERGGIVRKAGIMGIVIASGQVRPGDEIRVTLPVLPHRALERV